MRVGVAPRYKPVIYKEAGKVTGVEADFGQEFAAYLGKSVQFVEMTRQNLIPALLDRRIDIIMSGMSVTKMREVQIAFADPWFRTGQMAMVISANKNNYPSDYHLILGFAPKIKIGVVKGTTGDDFVRRNFGSAKAIKAFKSPQAAVDALLVDTVNMIVHDAPSILMLAAENQTRGVSPMPTLLTDEFLAWGIHRGNSELLDQTNQFITEIKSDGRIEKIVKRWIPIY